MPNRLKRASIARLAVGLAVLAFPLLATSVAPASIAGAIPSTTTIHPDLRSATIDPTIGSHGVRVCFNKALNATVSSPLTLSCSVATVPAACNTVGRGDVLRPRPDRHMCVLVSFPAAAGDINKYTILSVSAGAVEANAGLVPNLADSVTLTGSTSHSGTRGTTTAPNLVGVLAPSGTNQRHALVDVRVRQERRHRPGDQHPVLLRDRGGRGLPRPADCHALAGNGTTTITVVFNDAPCGGVVNAIKAGIFQGAVTAQADPLSSNPNVSTDLPNCGSPCPTQGPDLVSATLNVNGSDHVHVRPQRRARRRGPVPGRVRERNVHSGHGRQVQQTPRSAPRSSAATSRGSRSSQCSLGLGSVRSCRPTTSAPVG